MDDVFYKPDLVSIKKGEVTLFIDPKKPNWVAVNKSGARFLELCDGKKSRRDIARCFAPSVSNEEIDSFIEAGVQCEILSDKPFISHSYSGRSSFLKPEILEELWLYVTNKCNLRCSHCLVSAGENLTTELSTYELKEVLNEVFELGVKRIFFTGGEPFIRKDIFELIEFVTKELGLELVILSNGTLLDSACLDRLFGIPGLVLQISLEGPNPHVNDTIRGSGSYSETLMAIEGLRTRGIRTIVTSTATKENVEHISELSDQLYQKDVKTHHILWVHRKGRAEKNSLSVDNESLLHLMSDLKDKKIKVDNWEGFKARVYGGRGTKVDGCHAAYTSLSIDSNGDIYPCPSLNGERDFLMGNIKEGVRSVWIDSEIGRSFRGLSIANIDGCADCVLRFYCGGGCRCYAYHSKEKESLLSKDPYCSVIKEMLIESMLCFVNPNGHNKPEILGFMQKNPSFCDSRKAGSEGVSAFHCNCVLDVSIRNNVAARYGEAAHTSEMELCCPTDYTPADLMDLPKDTISISYGCGNPSAFADLKEGESVLDIGSGGGIDCFIAAKKVGKAGRVIGVDMTEEMLRKANKNKEKMADSLGFDVVEFRKGIIEELPVESNSMNLVISNCVINLSPDKKLVFEEMFRVLRNGGRFSISDIVSDKTVPEVMKQDSALWSGCISGALPKDEFIRLIEEAGFKEIVVEKSFQWKEVGGIAFHSVNVRGRKP